MATVYLAEDLKHHRRVAIKVLDPELAAALGPERFLKEIELTANLQHPNILPLFDSGAVDGMLYYVMPFVDGESLTARLRRETQLPVDDSVRIATEVASALEYAHRRGVIHRDIKPDNILFHEGRALVADFGIALVASPGERATATGMSVGTPSYMSPEQALAERNLTPQSDIYALGAVTYEMLAGEPPFSGPSAQAIIARVIAEPPRSLRIHRPGVPQSIESAVLRSLEKVPADRFATASDFARALTISGDNDAVARALAPQASDPSADITQIGAGRRVRRPVLRWSIAIMVALLVASLAMWRLTPWRRDGATDIASGKMLAVLPFENLGRPENEYFADGMSEEVRGKLAGLPGLMVIARSSSMEYKQTKKPARQIASELGVQYLLAATIRTESAGNGKPGRVRVTPELVQLVDGAPITRWQQAFDADMTDVFQVQADIAQRVAQALGVALAARDSTRLFSRPTQNLAAYDAFLQGEEVSGAGAAGDAPSLQRAIRFYERATILDTAYSEAFARLSVVRTSLFIDSPGTEENDGGVSALSAAQRAITLAPNKPDGRLAAALYYSELANDPDRAMEQARLALALAPGNPEAIATTAQISRAAGRWEEAVSYARQAQSLDPRSGYAAWTLGETLLWLRRYDEARKALDVARALSPKGLGMLVHRVMLELGRGDLIAARALITAAAKTIDPTALVSTFALANDLGWVLDDAQQRLLLSLSPQAFGGDREAWGTSLMHVHALRGENELARAYADSARPVIEAAIKVSPSAGDLHVYLAVVLAYQGDARHAEEEGRRAIALVPVTRQATTGAYIQHQLVRIYILTGQPEKALDQLEPLLRIPYYLSPGWLRIDPTFAPLRGNPRFERLLKP